MHDHICQCAESGKEIRMMVMRMTAVLRVKEVDNGDGREVTRPYKIWAVQNQIPRPVVYENFFAFPQPMVG